MSPSRRMLAASAAVVALLFALHVQLNLGGWPHFVNRLLGRGAARGELVVGYLPVT